jgi:hypothetical protein
MLLIHGYHLRTILRREGRGLIQVEGGCTVEVVKWMEYIESKEEPLIQTMRTHLHHTNSALFLVIKNFKKCLQSKT